MPSPTKLSRVQNFFYKFELVKRLKNRVRPLKHVLFGRDGIYAAIDEAARLSGGHHNIRTVFDVGAAMGEYTVHFLRAFPQATVYCFEPLPDSFAKLTERVKPYGDRVVLFPYALADREGEAKFHVAAYRDGSSLIDKGKEATQTILVRLRRLDDVMREIGVPKIDFMKIDVEGTELEVMRGGAAAFMSNVRQAFIEIWPEFKGHYSKDHSEIFRAFYEYGFGFGGNFGGSDYFFSKLFPRTA